MQLVISHKIDKPLVLPLAYHHILQSIIYRSLELNPEYSNFLHDRGFKGNARNYKLFTFGLLQGRYEIHGKDIIFTESVSFEIRSVEVYMLKMLKQSFEHRGITYGNNAYYNVIAELKNDEVLSEEILIRMLSPICIYSTDKESGKTKFYNPTEREFAGRIEESFRRKYEAYTGMEIDSTISIEVKRLFEKDKYVTKYKGFYINAWFGVYVLTGKRQHLDFLYQTGLGSKNSQGFGMFDIIS